MTVNSAHVESATVNTLSIQVGGSVELVRAHSDMFSGLYKYKKKRHVIHSLPACYAILSRKDRGSCTGNCNHMPKSMCVEHASKRL